MQRLRHHYRRFQHMSLSRPLPPRESNPGRHRKAYPLLRPIQYKRELETHEDREAILLGTSTKPFPPREVGIACDDDRTVAPPPLKISPGRSPPTPRFSPQNLPKMAQKWLSQPIPLK